MGNIATLHLDLLFTLLQNGTKSTVITFYTYSVSLCICANDYIYKWFRKAKNQAWTL